MTFAQLKCKKPAAGAKPLSAGDARKMAIEAPGWTVGDGRLEREFKFDGFRQAIDFVNELADLAEEQDHHPDILISYTKVRLTLTTDKIGGLSRNDFIMAAKINELIAGQY
jgi:4a-hydroxytetrahydrobiopterin dehydratase